MKRLTLMTIAVVAVVTACGDQSLLDPTQFVKPQFDDIVNNLDMTVDAGAETMSLTAGGDNGSTQLYLVERNGDGKNGCNLTGSTTLVAAVSSSNTTIATVSPASVTFTSCDDTPVLTVTPVGEGTATITLTLTSNTTLGSFDLAPAAFTANVAAPTPTNHAPVLGSITNQTVNEGTLLGFVATATDQDQGQTLTFSLQGVNVPSGASIHPTTGAFTWTPTDGPASATFRVVVTDNGTPALSDEEEITVTVNNVAPSVNIGLWGSSVAIVPLSSASATLAVSFTDPGSADTHFGGVDCDYIAGDANPVQTAATSPFTRTCTYTETGVYTVRAVVTDDDGGEGTTDYKYIVVYDPSAGFVTGGGWIATQAATCSSHGAFTCPSSVSGKASFGFVSKYLKGATIPTGNTEFVLEAGGLTLISSSYEWLVVNQNGSNAQFKGTGTLNGIPGAKFQIWASDGSTDSFRIRIWFEDTAEHQVFYTGDSAIPLTAPTGHGSIQIHQPKK